MMRPQAGIAGNRGEDWTRVIALWAEKAGVYRQGPDGDAELLDYLFLAELGVADWNGRYAAEIFHPDGSSLARFRSGARLSYVNEWLLDRKARSFPSLEALDRAIPNGRYACRISDGQGDHRFELALGGLEPRTILPPPPTMSLLQDGRGISTADSGLELTLAWTPFTPSPPSGAMGNSALFPEPAIFLLVDNCRGETVYSSGSGHRRPSLTASARSAVLPAGTLEPGMRYTAFLSFIDFRATCQSADASVAGVSVHSAMVELGFGTAGEPRDSRSCPPVELRACYRWPGKIDAGASLAAWPVGAGGLTLEPHVDRPLPEY